MPRLPAGIRISLKRRGGRTHRMELICPPFPQRFRVRRPRCYTQVVDPIGLVPMVKQIEWLTEETKNNRPPRARHAGEADWRLLARIRNSRAI
jgi:hypothetical protein